MQDLPSLASPFEGGITREQWIFAKASPIYLKLRSNGGMEVNKVIPAPLPAPRPSCSAADVDFAFDASVMSPRPRVNTRNVHSRTARALTVRTVVRQRGKLREQLDPR